MMLASKMYKIYQDSDFCRVGPGEVSESVVFKNKGPQSVHFNNINAAFTHVEANDSIGYSLKKKII